MQVLSVFFLYMVHDCHSTHYNLVLSMIQKSINHEVKCVFQFCKLFLISTILQTFKCFYFFIKKSYIKASTLSKSTDTKPVLKKSDNQLNTKQKLNWWFNLIQGFPIKARFIPIKTRFVPIKTRFAPMKMRFVSIKNEICPDQNEILIIKSKN